MNTTAQDSSRQATQPAGASNPSSAWSRGPPSGTASTPSSAIHTPTNPPTPPAAEAANGNGIVPAHSRKGSILVGGVGVDIKRGNIAFGTVDSPNPMLSSSPAAPSITGTHLAGTVQSFGSIEADSTGPDSVTARRASNNAGVGKLDAHALFGAKPKQNGTSPGPSHERRPSMTGYQNANGYPSNPSHLRPPTQGQQRPLTTPLASGPYGPQVQQGFRPNQMGGAPLPYRPNAPPVGPNPAMYMNRNMPGGQGPYMPYPNQYYDGFNMYQAPQYNVAQWAPQQHPQNQGQQPPLSSPYMPASPRPNPSQLHQATSPAPPPVSHGSVSPAPTPPSRPPSLMSHQPSPSNASSIPSTPSRPLMPTTSSFTPPVPSPAAFLSGSAASFTPRASKAIKLTRPDGTALDIKQAAAQAKGPMQTDAVPPPVDSTPKKVIALPVVVRMESETQRMARLKEEAEQARIRDIEAKEEEERKERKARQAAEAKEREEQEKRAAEEREQAVRLEKQRHAEEVLAKENAAEQASATSAEIEPQTVGHTTPTVAAQDQDETDVQSPTALRVEESRNLLTTPGPSAPPSPLSSPALAAAGLPPKPVSTIAPSARRHPPSALELNAASAPQSPAAASALTTARPIDDLSIISYPGSLKSPEPRLNIDAEPGKFRYDRDFLMQFMTVCRDKPENLPPLEEIGLEAADSSSGFGRGGRGGRTSMGGKASTGLGIGSVGRSSFPNQGMGSFRMGDFGTLRGSTSDERYQRSLTQGRGMARTPSQGGGHGLPSMSLSTSRSGTNRSRGGIKRAPAALDPDVAPLAMSNNAWVKSRPSGDDEGTPAFTERKVKSLLNKLTAEKFDSIAEQILEWANKSKSETDGITLKLVIKQIFEKATDEAHWSSMYAKLCRMLLIRLDPGITEIIDDKPVSGGMLFRKYLVGRCQQDFEAGWKAREDAATAAAAKSEEDRLAQASQKEGEEVVMLSDEYYAAQKAKRRGLGLVQLIGELYKLDMIGKGVIRTCFARLLGNVESPDEEDIESSCKLLTTVGEQYDQASPENMDIVFERLQNVLDSADLPSRLRFMIMDIKDMRAAGWASKRNQPGVTTIAEIHKQAAREQAEKSAAAAQASRESISRGGSRTGSRRDAQPGEWQSVAPAARQALPRPSDFSQLGRGVSSSGNAGPIFGGKSVFAKGKGKATGAATPPQISRQTSTTNMFSALDMGESSSAVTEPEPQRKKLALQPRTKPASDDDDENESVEEISMDADGAKSKIDRDMKELWGEKDTGGSRNPEDVAEYYRSLPEEHRSLLTRRLIDDGFRIAKYKDFEVVANSWSRAVDEGLVDKQSLIDTIKTRMPTLDDEALDFPQVYQAVGLLMRSARLDNDEIASLVAEVDLYGQQPKITPQMKMERALAALDSQ